MNHLIELLAREPVHLFVPGEYTDITHQVYKIVRLAIEAGADAISFEAQPGEPEHILLSQSGKEYKRPFESTWPLSLISVWRKILERDHEVARFFQVVEDTPERIKCRLSIPT